MAKLVYGIGVNDADYAVTKCLYYSFWRGILQRSYSPKNQERQPTYKGCSVSTEWHTFSNFKAWMERQDFEGKQLDKDILFEGNKTYSPETCVFVCGAVNNFITDCRASRGEWPIGVYWNRSAEKFQSQCRNPFTKKKEHLGYFTCEQEAHEAWLKRKLELAHELAAIQTDPRVAEALINRYSKPTIKE